MKVLTTNVDVFDQLKAAECAVNTTLILRAGQAVAY